MIGMTVGLFLVAGVMGLFVSNKRVYVQATRLTELQENSRFALDYLIRDLRHTGFFGESRWYDVQVDRDSVDDSDVTNNCGGNAAAYAIGVPIWGTSASAARVIDCIDDALFVSGIPSDVIVVKAAGRATLRDVNDNGTVGDGSEDANGDGRIDDDDKLKTNSLYIVSNTQQGLLLQTGDTASLTQVPTVTPSGDFPYGAYREYRYFAYYIRDDAPNDDEPPTLARMTLAWNGAAMAMQTEDLVEGVEAMRIIYGVDNDGDGSANRFSNAAGVSDWSRVVAIRLYLLLRTTEPDYSYRDTRSYRLGDVTVTATRGTTASQGAQLRNFRRLMVTTTLSLRNLQIAIQGSL
jgi:type IV pilus assembly protein PilW